MVKNKTYHKQSALFVFVCIMVMILLLMGRLSYIMIVQSVHYGDQAKELHERERKIKAARGLILDRNGVCIASNKPVCTISVIHSQITDREAVIKTLSELLGISEEKIAKRVDKVSSIERIKSNVDKELADKIREYHLDGVMIDEDYKRYYPYESLASKVIGFTGSDNQGIIGLEVAYDKYLQGKDGRILTLATARGVEIENAAEDRIEPVAGNNLKLSLDVNIQKYAEQAAKKVQEAKEANYVRIILMNPKNGELYACVNVPEFDLNKPYELNIPLTGTETDQEKNNLLNEMWRNPCVSDTYEPGSAFKIVTATAALEEKVVGLNDNFFCPGFKIVEDRKIRCHKVGGHGAETFAQGIMNSCNPVFMEVGARVGAANMYKTFRNLGLFQKSGIDVPGEANSIMHDIKNIKPVELATISFGQSFQITPLQLLSAVSAVINGGHQVTPHFATEIVAPDGHTVKTVKTPQKENLVTKETSETMRVLLEKVVSEGSGNKAFIEGFQIGGKTATSEKLPRGTGKYIASFLGFAPADDPVVIGIVLIDEPTGIYYGGTIAAPVMKEVFANVLPYLGVDPLPTETGAEKQN